MYNTFCIGVFSYKNAASAIAAIASDYGISHNNIVDDRFLPTPVTTAVSYTLKQEKSDLVLPPSGINTRTAFHYLCNVRCIDLSVVRYFHSRKLFYEDDKHNCVFVSNNFACVRSTSGRFMYDVPGSNYNNCFFEHLGTRINTDEKIQENFNNEWQSAAKQIEASCIIIKQIKGCLNSNASFNQKLRMKELS